MRLGLIGTGKQGQRYLLEKNGGRHITVSGSRRIPLDDVDGVIIATHPAGHKELALECIAAGKAVLIEKPLALNLRDAMAIIDFAEKRDVFLRVAHTHLWSRDWRMLTEDGDHIGSDCDAWITYQDHSRDYSPWLDWAPHGLALLADMMPDAEPDELRRSLLLEQNKAQPMVCVKGLDWEYHCGKHQPIFPEPMWTMVKSFCNDANEMDAAYDFNRRVYRALFAE